MSIDRDARDKSGGPGHPRAADRPASRPRASRPRELAVAASALVAVAGGALPASAAARPGRTLAQRAISPLATRSTLPGSGGTAVVRFAVRKPGVCAVRVRNHPWVTVRLPRAIRRCTGRETFRVEVGANAEPVRQPIVLVITEHAGRSTAKRTVELEEEGRPAPGPIVPPPAKKVPDLSPSGAPSTTATTLPVAATSDNWSGYALASPSGPFTSVQGEFAVPTLDCSATPDGGMSTWGGVGGETLADGSSSGPLLQTGVNSNCVDGAQVNTGWNELYPSDPNHANYYAGLQIAAGDTIRVSVYQVGSTWDTRLDDLTTATSGWLVASSGWGVAADGASSFALQGQTDFSYPGASTAEWIVEDYRENGTDVPFANYGAVRFTELSTSAPSWSLDPSESIAIEQHGAVLSRVTGSGSDSFTLAYG